MKHEEDYTFVFEEDPDVKVSTRRKFKISLQKRKPHLKRLSEYESKPIPWLWEPYISREMLTILEGDPGEGKSMISQWLGTQVSIGGGLPGMGNGKRKRGTVVFASAEDSPVYSIRPRLEAMGADLDRIHMLEDLLTLDLEGAKLLAELALDVEADLIVIDPIQSYLGAKVDSNKQADVRNAMQCVVELAKFTKAAVLVVRHLRKRGRDEPVLRGIHAGMGSIDFTAIARSVLQTVKLADGSRYMYHAKTNGPGLGLALPYFLERGATAGRPLFRWGDGISEEQLSSLIDGIGMSKECPKNKTNKDKAKDYLLRKFEEQDVWYSEEIKTLAHQEAGLLPATLDRARKALKIDSAQEPGGKRWLWRRTETGVIDERWGTSDASAA